MLQITKRREQENAPAKPVVRRTVNLVLPRQYPPEDVQRVHQVLIDELSTVDIARESRSALLKAAREVIDRLGFQYTNTERDDLAVAVVDEIVGHGPIEPLLREDRITDILINGPSTIFCEIDGVNQQVPFRFRDDEHLMHHIDRIVSGIGRRVDESSPIVNARLKDGSRVNVILSPLSIDGSSVSIRKFRKVPNRVAMLVENRSLATWMIDFLNAAVKARLNILISGGTGAGKTTLLNTIAEAVPDEERILTIEDSAELQIQKPDLVRLEVRPANLEGRGAITQRDLVINALRMKPDRIIVGECRGREAFDMLQAMNTGHDGSLTTVHANSPRDALSRLQNMVLMGEIGLSEEAIKAQIASAIQLVVQAARLPDGNRKIVAISEITGMQGPVISMQEIFRFHQKSTGENGQIHGVFTGEGIVPECLRKIELGGKNFEPGFFTQKLEV